MTITWKQLQVPLFYLLASCVGQSYAFTVSQPLLVPQTRVRQASRPSCTYSSSGRRSLLVTYMGWGPEPIWSEAKVISNSPANQSGSCISLTVQVQPDVAQGYTVPGQYVQIKPSDDSSSATTIKPIFLACASPPPSSSKEGKDDPVQDDDDNCTLEFLIKKTDTNSWITSMQTSSTLAISQVMGKGFPIKENLEGFKYDFPTQQIYLLCNGSGIAPIRAAIESGQLHVSLPGRGGRTARLYYGVRSTADLSYVDKFESWEAAGFEVVPVISRPELDQDTIKRVLGTSSEQGKRTGYVQNALEEDGISIPRNSGALLCGVKGMVDSTRSLLLKAGVFEGRVMTNF